MEVLLFRHGRNHYEDIGDEPLAGQLNPAGEFYANYIPKFSEIVARIGKITEMHAWQDEAEYDRCVGTLKALSEATKVPIEKFIDSDKALGIARNLKASNKGGCAVMCVRSQDLKRLKEVFPNCDVLLGKYEVFVIYEQAQPGQGEYTARVISMGHEEYPASVKKFVIDRVYKTP